MTHEYQTLNIPLLDKSWQIRCPEHKATDLQKSARLLDAKMRDITNYNRTLGTEKTVIIAALNAIDDLFAQLSQKDLYIESLGSHVRELQSKLNSTIPQNGELPL